MTVVEWLTRSKSNVEDDEYEFSKVEVDREGDKHQGYVPTACLTRVLVE